MAYVSGASLQPIVNRLNSAAPYHPLEANTFADWSLEAGDTVTVSRDGTSYASPVHTSKLTWRKQAQVAISSTGNETRESISKLSSQRYRSGNSGLRNSHYQHIYVNDLYDQMTSGLELTGSTASLYVQNLYDQMKAGLDLTSSTAHLYVNNMYLQMKAGLQLTASSAALYVQNKTTKAQLLLEINGAGKSQAYLEADVIKLGNATGGSTITLNNRLQITSDGYLYLPGNVYQNLTDDYYIQTREIQLIGSSSSQGATIVNLKANDLKNMIVQAQVSGNTLYLWKYGDTLTSTSGASVSFSKATSLTGSWGRGNNNEPNGVFTVTATPQNETVTTSITAGAVTWSYGTGTLAIKATIGNSATLYDVRTLTVTSSATAGVSSVTWDSTNKKFKATGYAYLNGGSSPVDSKSGESSALSIGDDSWSSGTKKVWVKHGTSEILTDYVSIPAVSATDWQNPSGHTWKARLTIGDTYRYSSEHTFYTETEYNTAAASVPSGYSANSSTTITNGNIVGSSIGVYSGHYACNMNLTLNFGDGTTRSADVTGGVIVDDIVEYGRALGSGGGGGGESSPDYSLEFVSWGSAYASDIANTLKGWSPYSVSSSPGASAQQKYRYIKFKVDGVKRSFYFA